MGSEQSHVAARETTREDLSPLVLQSPTTAALREGAVSPRQGSVCSDADVPYVSYTVNKPIGDSPKKTNEKSSKTGRFMSPRLGRSFNRERLAASRHNTLVTVHRDLKLAPDIRHDADIVRLQEIPAFLPIMRASITTARGGQEQEDILNRLDSQPIYCLMKRYQDHLRACATVVASEQGNINKMVRDVDTAAASVTSAYQERHKKYQKHCERLGTVREVSRNLAKCHMLLNENIDMLDALNNVLPVDQRLEPFVWTTG